MQISQAQRKMINAVTIAKKNGVSAEYVRKILSGERVVKSEKSKKIMSDALKIIEAIEKL